MDAKYGPVKLKVPRGFSILLQRFAREVIREQPSDIAEFGATYFQNLVIERKISGEDPLAGDPYDEPGYHAPRKTILHPISSRVRQEEIKRENAAVKIQAGYKGYVTRRKSKQVRKAKEAAEKKQTAATRIQAQYRGYRTRKSLRRPSPTKQEPSPSVIVEPIPDVEVSMDNRNDMGTEETQQSENVDLRLETEVVEESPGDETETKPQSPKPDVSTLQEEDEDHQDVENQDVNDFQTHDSEEQRTEGNAEHYEESSEKTVEIETPVPNDSTPISVSQNEEEHELETKEQDSFEEQENNEESLTHANLEQDNKTEEQVQEETPEEGLPPAVEVKEEELEANNDPQHEQQPSDDDLPPVETTESFDDVATADNVAGDNENEVPDIAEPPQEDNTDSSAAGEGHVSVSGDAPLHSDDVPVPDTSFAKDKEEDEMMESGKGEEMGDSIDTDEKVTASGEPEQEDVKIQENESGDATQELAAVKIQSRYRGYRTRKQLKSTNAEPKVSEEDQSEA